MCNMVQKFLPISILQLAHDFCCHIIFIRWVGDIFSSLQQNLVILLCLILNTSFCVDVFHFLIRVHHLIMIFIYYFKIVFQWQVCFRRSCQLFHNYFGWFIQLNLLLEQQMSHHCWFQQKHYAQLLCFGLSTCNIKWLI